MAVNTNDSFNRCLAELRARYRGRGIAAGIEANGEKNLLSDAKRKEFEFDGYIYFDPRTGIADSFKSGEYKGSRYMTSDDFIRYFRSRRQYTMPVGVKNKEQVSPAEARPRTVGARRTSGNSCGGLVPSDNSKEGHSGSRLKDFFLKIYNERDVWLHIDPKNERRETGRARLPVGAMGAIAVFALSLGLIVSSYAMVGSATAQVGRINNRIAVLQTEQKDLQGKLDLKYNISDIEKDALALGMIKSEYASHVYLESEKPEKIKIYEEEKDTFSFAALLNALGFKTK